MLKLKSGSNTDLTHWPVTPPDPVIIAYPVTQWPGDPWPGSISGAWPWRALKVIRNDAIRKAIHYFPSAVRSNNVVVLQRFPDTATCRPTVHVTARDFEKSFSFKYNSWNNTSLFDSHANVLQQICAIFSKILRLETCGTAKWMTFKVTVKVQLVTDRRTDGQTRNHSIYHPSIGLHSKIGSLLTAFSSST